MSDSLLFIEKALTLMNCSTFNHNNNILWINTPSGVSRSRSASGEVCPTGRGAEGTGRFGFWKVGRTGLFVAEMEYRIQNSGLYSLIPRTIMHFSFVWSLQLGTYFEVHTHNKAGSALPDTPAKLRNPIKWAIPWSKCFYIWDLPNRQDCVDPVQHFSTTTPFPHFFFWMKIRHPNEYLTSTY